MTEPTIDYQSPLPGTVKFYNQHVIVCSGHANWSAKIEDDVGFEQQLTTAIKTATLPAFVRITACDAPSMGAGVDVMLYPAAKKFIALTEADIPAFLEVLQGKPKSQLAYSFLEKQVWLVCTHGTRDVRCATCGSAIFEALKTTLDKMKQTNAVEVWRSSHIGGHHFAANVLCYPSANWYGRVTENDVADLIDAELLKQIPFTKLWRGQMGLTQEQQLTINNY